MNTALSIISNSESFVFFLNAGDKVVSSSSLIEVIQTLRRSTSFWTIVNSNLYNGQEIFEKIIRRFLQIEKCDLGQAWFSSTGDSSSKEFTTQLVNFVKNILLLLT